MKILAMLAICAVTFLAWFIGIFIIAFSGMHDFYQIIVTVLAVLFIVFCACALWKVLKKKCVYIPICVVLVSCIVATAGFYGYERYIDSIPVIDESENLLIGYAPYIEDSKVAELGEVSDLILTENIPRMDGATALFPVYSAFAKAVYPRELLENIAVKSGSKYKIESNQYLKCSTTAGAYERIVTGAADIIFAAAPSDEQKQFAKDNGVELVYTPIGKEAFVFFVNSKNTIDDISLDQIQGIYSGEISEWSELGVDGFGEIKAFQRDEGSGSQSTLMSIMDGKELMTPPQENVIDGMGGIIDRTADYKNFKNAIGYSFRFYSTEMVKNNQIKLLSVNGIEPNIENIENGTYPIASYFYAVARSDMSDNTKKLINWILSEQGQQLIELTGYTSVN